MNQTKQPDDEHEHIGSKEAAQRAIVSLTVYNWHTLLLILEDVMKIINRDTSHAIRLYEAIATQLNDNRPVVIEGVVSDTS